MDYMNPRLSPGDLIFIFLLNVRIRKNEKDEIIIVLKQLKHEQCKQYSLPKWFHFVGYISFHFNLTLILRPQLFSSGDLMDFMIKCVFNFLFNFLFQNKLFIVSGKQQIYVLLRGAYREGGGIQALSPTLLFDQ